MLTLLITTQNIFCVLESIHFSLGELMMQAIQTVLVYNYFYNIV